LEARQIGANDYMYWELMRRAVETGVEWFDFGRSKVGTGAYAFKKNWGFEPQQLPYAYWLRKIDALPEINPLNPKYRLAIAAWKRLPLPIANWLGPRLARNLG
jgi:lipid II:glycine glycyltransferase (peptidoglycan interpeptide bridge formation enzyme)